MPSTENDLKVCWLHQVLRMFDDLRVAIPSTEYYLTVATPITDNV